MKDRIFVIDGSSYLYRAFHAMPPLSTSTGIPTGAIKGVTNMLMTLKKDSEGSPIIVVFDAKGKTFRNDIFSSYKANRPPMPDDLRSQIEPVKLICKAIGFPLLIIDGVEADDVIATVAEKAKNRNLKCVISSLDKDLMQLVEDPKVSMMNTMTHQIFDEEKVLDKFGVKPTQIRDLLALTGDSSDNIPGIPKVGQKTAAKWLNEFENITNIKSNADSIKGVVGDNLRGFITDLDRNIELVSLKRDVDLKVKFEDLLIANPNEDELERIFKELEFTNPNSVKEAPATKKDNKYETVLTEKELNNWILKINECNSFAIDTETDSVQTVSANLLGISLSVSENEGCYIPLGHQYDDCPKQLEMDYVIKSLGSAIEDNQEKAIGQNLKFDIPILARHGIKITKFLADTMLMSYVLNSTATRHGMDRLADFYLNYKTTKYTDVTGTASKQISFAEVKLDVATDYAAEDADITLRLYKVLNKLLKEKPTQQKLLNDLEYPLVHVLSRVEQNGAKIDKKKLSNHSKELSEKISDLTSQAFKILSLIHI